MSTTGRELDAVEGAEGRLRLALSSLRAAKQLVEDAEDQLYGYRCRDGRAGRRIDDAIEATMARLQDVGPGEPGPDDEPVDLADAPSWVCSDCGAQACHQVGPRRYCESCFASHLDVAGPDEPVDLHSPPR